MPASILAVGDVLENTTSEPPTEAVLNVREKTVSFCKLLQSLDHVFISDLFERRKTANWSIAARKWEGFLA